MEQTNYNSSIFGSLKCVSSCVSDIENISEFRPLIKHLNSRDSKYYKYINDTWELITLEEFDKLFYSCYIYEKNTAMCYTEDEDYTIYGMLK